MATSTTSTSHATGTSFPGSNSSMPRGAHRDRYLDAANAVISKGTALKTRGPSSRIGTTLQQLGESIRLLSEHIRDNANRTTADIDTAAKLAQVIRRYKATIRASLPKIKDDQVKKSVEDALQSAHAVVPELLKRTLNFQRYVLNTASPLAVRRIFEESGINSGAIDETQFLAFCAAVDRRVKGNLSVPQFDAEVTSLLRQTKVNPAIHDMVVANFRDLVHDLYLNRARMVQGLGKVVEDHLDERMINTSKLAFSPIHTARTLTGSVKFECMETPTSYVVRVTSRRSWVPFFRKPTVALYMVHKNELAGSDENLLGKNLSARDIFEQRIKNLRSRPSSEIIGDVLPRRGFGRMPCFSFSESDVIGDLLAGDSRCNTAHLVSVSHAKFGMKVGTIISSWLQPHPVGLLIQDCVAPKRWGGIRVSAGTSNFFSRARFENSTISFTHADPGINRPEAKVDLSGVELNKNCELKAGHLDVKLQLNAGKKETSRLMDMVRWLFGGKFMTGKNVLTREKRRAHHTLEDHLKSVI